MITACVRLDVKQFPFYLDLPRIWLETRQVANTIEHQFDCSPERGLAWSTFKEKE